MTMLANDLPDMPVEVTHQQEGEVRVLWSHSTADALATILRRHPEWVHPHATPDAIGRRLSGLEARHAVACSLYRKTGDDAALRLPAHFAVLVARPLHG
ncbi:MAG: hypothetical protein ACOYOQ_00085 [Microthrixaceae bacterium]